MWITHTGDLVKQAKERCEGKMVCKTSTITEGKCDTSGDIVFSTVQTLIKYVEEGKIPQETFGMLIVDECFPAGTKINTPNGYRNIEDIKYGDIVYSYNHNTNKIEEKKVIHLFNKQTDELVQIKLSNGKVITCTPNHPIYCNGDYIRADSIKKGDVIYEMQSLWCRDNKRQFHEKTMEKQNKKTTTNGKDILFTKLQSESIGQLFNSTKQNNKTSRNDTKQPSKRPISSEENIKNIKRNETQTKKTRRKWSRFDSAARDFVKRTEKTSCSLYTRICGANKNEKRYGISNLLQNRFGDCGQNDRDRNRRFFSHIIDKTRTRLQKTNILRTVRVESVEIQKRRDTNKTRQRGNGNIVYNIGVEDNHNYFVNDILVHNCHRVSTNPQSIQMFRSCIDYFAARYRIGLTATVHRADGLADCIKLIIGDIIYQIEKSGDQYVCRYENEILLRFPIDKFQVPAQIEVIETNYNLEDKDVYSANGGTIQFATLISDLAMNEDRNKIIIDQLRKIEGSTLVLSDRVEQLKYLCSQVENGVQIDGGTPKKQREKALKDVDEGKKKYLFASYNLAKEGLSLNILSNLVMATPVKDFAIVSQSIGRIQRPYEGKIVAKVYDFVDDVGMLMGFYTKRRSTYRKNNWKIENIYLERGR